MIPPTSPPDLPSTSPVQQFDANLDNKWWRLQHLYRIRDKNAQLTYLRFNNIQLEIIKSLEGIYPSEPIRKFFLKYRQGGVSTFWLLFWLDETIFNYNTISGVMADAKENLGYLFEIVRLAHANMPTAVQPDLGEDSKSSLSFPALNSKMFVSLGIKSTAIHNLHISEICHCDDVDIQTTIGACSPRTNITCESTGHGVGNQGYEMYQQGRDWKKRPNSRFQSHFYPWFIQDEYRIPLNGMEPPALTKDEQKLADLMRRDWDRPLLPEQVLWRRETAKLLRGLRRQEFPETDDDAFLASGNKFFNTFKVHTLLKEAKEWARENPYPEEGEEFIFFEKPIKGDVYVAGADTADGGADYSVLKIINVTKRREAFVYRARCTVPTFYKVCDKYGRMFNNALLCVERNNHGRAIILGLTDVTYYPNLWEDDMHSTRAKDVIVADALPKRNFGWLTDGSTREILLDQFKYGVEGEEDQDEENFAPACTFYDVTLLDELLTFEEVDGKFQAIEGKHDDDLFATALAFQMFQRMAKFVGRGKSETGSIFTAGEKEAGRLYEK